MRECKDEVFLASMSDREHHAGVLPRVADFYDGRSVLITGAAGFLGGVLLEILLRTCPGLERVYILVRKKKGLDPIKRREVILGKQLYQRLRKENPQALDKVRVVAGDVSQPWLGMSEGDLDVVVRDISVIFHAAAEISFCKTYSYMMKINVMSLKYCIDIAKKSSRIDALVYTSTAYCNTNKPLDEIEEIIYRLPYTGERMLKEIERGGENRLLDLMENCGHSWANSYCFSKCVAESMLLDLAKDLRVAVIRPSVISNCWKQLPGYAEENSGFALMCIGIGKGFVRVLHSDPDALMDIMPADVCANAHILAAVNVATLRSCPSPLVVNCASRRQNRHTNEVYSSAFVEMVRNHPMPNAYRTPSVTVCKDAPSYWFYSVLEHYAPAFVIDAILKIAGRKPKLVRLYGLFEKLQYETRFFTQRDWEQQDKNLLALADGLHPDDKEEFVVDAANYDIRDLTDFMPALLPMFNRREKRGTLKERQRVVIVRSVFTAVIKYTVLLLFGYFLYIILYQLGCFAGLI